MPPHDHLTVENHYMLSKGLNGVKSVAKEFMLVVSRLTNSIGTHHSVASNTSMVMFSASCRGNAMAGYLSP